MLLNCSISAEMSAIFFLLFVQGIISSIASEFFGAEFINCFHKVKQFTIMTHYKDCSPIGLKKRIQFLSRKNIQVVRGFIHEHQPRLMNLQPHEKHFGFFSTAQRFHFSQGMRAKIPKFLCLIQLPIQPLRFP